jgi:type III secretion system FlhB-like substrate exporter
MAFWTISDRVGQFISLSSRNVPLGLEFIATTAITLVIQVAVALLILALPDYLFERHKHKESLKMTKQEVKEERKQQDGDPLIKSRLRERMRQILNQNMLQNVPKADVVITNPTHYAIGLGWDNEVMNAPTVLAKGMDHMALKIREVAEENQIPMVENKPLARALYSSVEVGGRGSGRILAHCFLHFGRDLPHEWKTKDGRLRWQIFLVQSVNLSKGRNEIGIAVAFVVVIAMLIIPMNAGFLDFFMILNLSFSLLVVMIVFFTQKKPWISALSPPSS